MILCLWLFLTLFLLLQRKDVSQYPIRMKSNTSPPPVRTSLLDPTSETPTPMDIIDYDMNGAMITIHVGDKRKVLLAGNATTGYRWRIVKMEGDSVRTTGKWKYRPSFPFLVGSGGYFQFEFEALQQGMTDVYFIYDPVAEPQLGYYFYLRFQVI